MDLKAGSHESISDPILLKFIEVTDANQHFCPILLKFIEVTDANQHFYELTSLKKEP